MYKLPPPSPLFLSHIQLNEIYIKKKESHKNCKNDDKKSLFQIEKRYLFGTL